MRRRVGYLIVLLCSLLCVASMGPLLVVQDGVGAADAIIVIGGDHKLERMQRAIELYQQGLAPVVVISAGTLVWEGDERVPEAEVMRRQAVTLGLPEEAITLESDSFSTFGNAHYSKQIAQGRGWDSVLLVTSAYHSRRARRIFHEVFGSEIAISVQPASQPFCSLCWWVYPQEGYVVLYEYWNWLRYWLGLDGPPT